MTTRVFTHTPVLLREAMDALRIRRDALYLDATMGGGGHSTAIANAGGRVIGIDQDPDAIAYAAEWVRDKPIQVIPGSFGDLARLVREVTDEPFAGVLFDLGMSSNQIETSGRGFSFMRDEPLDMRMDTSLTVTAADLVNALGRKELYDLFRNYGEEPRAGLYSAAIVRARRETPLTTSGQLAMIIKTATASHTPTRIHPATRVFQALRIAVNDELGQLSRALSDALSLLAPAGRLVVISFHSLEDRIAKDVRHDARVRVVGGLVRPSEAEVRQNPRARSARMRVYEML